MTTFKVYHASPRADFLCELDLATFPTGFVHVADVQAENVDEVYERTNHIDSDWTKGKHVVKVHVPRARSTSCGDVILDPHAKQGQAAHRCEDLGWTAFTPREKV